jgi:predicted NAD/FAD-binding protein
MRIGIIGAGISGLAVAHMLQERHELIIYDGADYAGGHTNTVRVDTPNQTHHVDTGFIVFNDRNYPQFGRLLGRLGVAWQPSTMSFSVSDGVDFEYSSGSPPPGGIWPARGSTAWWPIWPGSIGAPPACCARRVTIPRSANGSIAIGSRARSSSA